MISALAAMWRRLAGCCRAPAVLGSAAGFRASPRIGKQAVVSLLLPLLSLSFPLSLLPLQPAAAQQTLISNINRHESDNPVPVQNDRIQSQSFQTGNVTDGYTLHSIALRFLSLGPGSIVGGGRAYGDAQSERLEE